MTRYLFVSIPVGPLGSGSGGGVELTLTQLAQQLVRQGDQVHVLAPAGSVIKGIPCTTAPGLSPPPHTQNEPRDQPVAFSLPSVLANVWKLAHEMQEQFDIIVNWAYDWLPFYLTSFFRTPVAHIISVGSLSDNLDLALQQVLTRYPGTVAVQTQAQAETFNFASPTIQSGHNPFFVLPYGINLSEYEFVPSSHDFLCWIGRISPEKGLEDCAAVAQQTQIPVYILGRMQDVDYWHRVRLKFPDAPLMYRGFLSTQQMQEFLGQARCLLMTPKWVEAFGMAVVEAMACGVPTITYNRGGPAEIVRDGETGWVVEPDSVSQMIAALDRIPDIDRAHCRQWAESHYSLEVMTQTFKTWTHQVMTTYPTKP